MQQDRPRAVGAARGEQVARQAAGKYLRVVAEQRQGVPEDLHARRVSGPRFRTVQVVPVIEERLPEVLSRPQPGAAGADLVACRQRRLALLGQARREAGPGPVPAVAITGSDLPGDGQALAHVGHARIGLADAALELAVEILVIEIQLPRVSRDQILAAALRIVDANDLEQLTMRRLGAELGVDPMTIYGHVPDKTALFDGLVELVLAEVTLPGRTGEWARDFRAAAHAARATLLAHPHLIPLLGTRPPVTQPAFTLWESLTSILLDAGLSEEQAADGADCLGRLLIGHALAEAGQPPGGEVGGGEEEHRQAQAALAAARYPALSRVAQAGIVHDPGRIFDLALDGLILALQARRPDGW